MALVLLFAKAMFSIIIITSFLSLSILTKLHFMKESNCAIFILVEVPSVGNSTYASFYWSDLQLLTPLSLTTQEKSNSGLGEPVTFYTTLKGFINRSNSSKDSHVRL